MDRILEIEYEGIVGDNLVDLEKAHMALDELLNEYEWINPPDARKAMEYAQTVHPDEKCDEQAKNSWKYMADYRKIMWLVNIARDYCYSALNACKEAYCGGIKHE